MNSTIALIMLLLSIVISSAIAVLAFKKAKEMPDSVSSFSYLLGPTTFTLWVISLVTLLLFPTIFAVPNHDWIVFAMCSGLMLVGASPYYRSENKVIHYLGGYLFGITSQVLVVLSSFPYTVALWLLFPIVFAKKTWRENATSVSEAICFFSLIISLIVSLI